MPETARLTQAARAREATLHGQRTPPGRTPPPARRRGPRALLTGLVVTARPRQWVKNLLVLAAPAAAGRLLSVHALTQLALVFVLFTACAAAVYLVNDARDAEADRAHPVKRHRPVAAGQVPVPLAHAVGGALAVLAPLLAAVLASPAVAALLAVYVAMQLAYCLRLKHVLVVDLAVVTTGFLMRAMAGGLALGIPLSRWFLITTGFGALFMVSAKRYSEAVQMAGKDGATRALLTEYTTGYLRFVWQLAAGVAVLAYCLWALEEGGDARDGLLPWRQLSVVAFILAILRYAVFADRGTAGEPEEVVLRDRGLALIGLVWLALYGLAVAHW
ncbi:phosphoribose diphosphate:decaprenyl-phosphate phosphoribosyltransferase [Streptomyces zinciresistens K42]|uniref:Decaprenyl-phosphate phosphoribosyltransferase n=1 Tax=Streptomyces zinciresistens K42 TaxID=700597 RepID=G2GNZ2_9ACTN|nr:decaprenyl-phosphate phosphoribosyltransferase [Streptomyces zinciresistens]EGX54778.1 phosphoribose diphosphate:decaprenyl-phosphate phosphoribosyltransferase [Streptomyces zinciresistens K42]